MEETGSQSHFCTQPRPYGPTEMQAMQPTHGEHPPPLRLPTHNTPMESHNPTLLHPLWSDPTTPPQPNYHIQHGLLKKTLTRSSMRPHTPRIQPILSRLRQRRPQTIPLPLETHLQHRTQNLSASGATIRNALPNTTQHKILLHPRRSSTRRRQDQIPRTYHHKLNGSSHPHTLIQTSCPQRRARGYHLPSNETTRTPRQPIPTTLKPTTNRAC